MPQPTSPWNLGGLSLRALGLRVWNEAWKDEVMDRAAALSYYFLFALFPALLFLTTLLGLLPVPRLMDQLMGYLDRALPPDAASVLQKILGEVVRGARGGLLSAGGIGALWTASSGMASVMSALNVAYGAADARAWWKRRLVAVFLTLVFAAFVIAALLLLVFGGKIGEIVATWIGLGRVFTVAWNVVQWPVAAVLGLIALGLVYYLAPAVQQPWYWVTPGSAFTLVMMLAMSAGLRAYVAHFANYNSTYGSIGGVILLLLWLYLSGVVLLTGAEINSEIEHAAAERGRPVATRAAA